MNRVEGLVQQMLSSQNDAACAALRELLGISADSDAVYPYFQVVAERLSHKNSLMRNRALLLLAANAQWDADDRFSGVIDEYLGHITDPRPITSRQCIQSLPCIAAEKPQLASKICAALRQADVSHYADSMRPLLSHDIAEALEKIEALYPGIIS